MRRALFIRKILHKSNENVGVIGEIQKLILHLLCVYLYIFQDMIGRYDENKKIKQ